jgi:hypothetical protein
MLGSLGRTSRRFYVWIAAGLLSLAGTPARAEIFYGDLHAHSSLSDDASNPPDSFFVVARDLAGLDFVVLSDHDIFLNADEWEILKTTASSFNDEGRFVAFSAIEWSQASWHMNVYFRHDDEPYCPLRSCRTDEDFYSFYGPRVHAEEAAAHVNHPTDPFFPVTWTTIDDTVTTSVEVWNSATGSEEHRHRGALWALRAGFHLGLVGVSDDHHTDDRPPLIGTGLTGCHANALTRDDLLESIRARRCFATNGRRIALDMTVGGTAMGGTREATIGRTIPARIEVTATATPVTVELVQGGRTIASRRCDTPVCDLSAAVRVVDPNDFVYARVHQDDGGHAWSSPVWLRGECSGASATDPAACLASRLGQGDSECVMRWLTATGSRPRGESPRLICRDGDPSCDADAERGVCSFRVGLCFGLNDRGAASGCALNRIESFAVTAPAEAPPSSADPVDVALRETLLAMHRASTTAADKPACTPLSLLQVPVGRREIELRAHARVDLAGIPPGIVAVDDVDRLTLECTPARAPARTRIPRLRAGLPDLNG